MRSSRRSFLRSSAAAGLGAWALALERVLARDDRTVSLARQITQGPRNYWLGYYDKDLFDPSGRYVLGLSAAFDFRDPEPSDPAVVGMIDLWNNDRWIPLDLTWAWCWQLGSMLQWRPGSNREILFNDRVNGRWVCQVLDVFTGRKRTVNQSIYTVSPDGRTALTVDFGRLWNLAPGYGCPGIPDPNAGVKLPENDGIWRVDLDSGATSLILSIADVARFGPPFQGMRTSPNYLKHMLFNPDGSRFLFLQRWYPQWPSLGVRWTRALTANPDGSDLRVLDGSGYTSHFDWRSTNEVLAWTNGKGVNGYFLFDDADHGARTGGVTRYGKGVLTWNGHQSFLPDPEWLILDTYPTGPKRMQSLFLHHEPTRTLIGLGRYPSPPAWGLGTWRCDLHPCLSRDGRWAVFQSPHMGSRQLFAVDLEPFLD